MNYNYYYNYYDNWLLINKFYLNKGFNAIILSVRARCYFNRGLILKGNSFAKKAKYLNIIAYTLGL